MALTETTPKALGFVAPHFELLNVVSDVNQSLQDLKGQKATVVIFMCNHCPYVIHVLPELLRLADSYQERGVSFIAISSNDVERYPSDAPLEMKKLAKEMGFPFPYLYDESQSVARAYDAACTPDFSVFDAELKCVYRGRMDDSTPGNGKELSGSDLRLCLERLLNDQPAQAEQFPSMGCSIKWKS